jgi:hypothetical protein
VTPALAEGLPQRFLGVLCARVDGLSEGIPDTVQKTGGDNGGKCDEDGDDQVIHHVACKVSRRSGKHVHEPRPSAAPCLSPLRLRT